MTAMAVNDRDVSGGHERFPISSMTVVELAAFLRVSRSAKASSAGEVAATLGHWFDCDVDPQATEATLRAMIGRGWLASAKGGVRPASAGRGEARIALRGLIRMLDQGTRMIEVAAMTTMLKLAGFELDGEQNDEEDHDA